MDDLNYSKEEIRNQLLRFSRPSIPEWYIPINDDDKERLNSSGNLILIDLGPDMYISQSIANNIESALVTIDALRKKADSLGLRILFRGQTRDYFDTNGNFSVLPSAFRPNIQSPFGRITNIEEIRMMLLPWIEFLSLRKIDIGELLKFETLDESGIGILRVFEPGNYSGKIPSDGAIGILQHYGFPTYFIDASANEFISLWFALNMAVKASNNEIQMIPVSNEPFPEKWNSAQEISKWPTLHVYFHRDGDSEYPIIDLRDLKEFHTDSIRPKVQEGFVLPFKRCVKVSPLENVWTYENDCRRWPHHVIKLGFDGFVLHKAFPNFTKQSLLPNDDPIYKKILSLGLPGVVKYAV